MFVRPMALDGDAGERSGGSDGVEVQRARRARLAKIHREGAEELPARGKYRMRPARLKTVAQRDVAEIAPQRIGGDVRHDDELATVGRGAARSHARPDGDSLDGLVVFRGQA